MKKHDLINEIRVQRSDSGLASSRAAALEIEIAGEGAEIARLEKRLASAREQRAKLIDHQSDAYDEERFAAGYAERLGLLLVNVELGELSEGGIQAAMITARHAAHEAAQVVDVEIVEGDDEVVEHGIGWE